MRTLLVALVIALVAARTIADDRRTDTTKLRVMTLNAEFMWDGVEPEEGQVEFDWKGKPAKAKAHMKNVAAIIKQGNPDILNLCEVENLEALELLNSAFLSDLGYEAYLDKGTDSFTGQDVCVLTRIDPLGEAVARDGREGTSGSSHKSVSKNYVARFDIGGLKIALIGAHLLARPDDESRKPERQAQAGAIVGMAKDERSGGFLPIILGDFNDYDGVDRDHVGNVPITTVLKRMRGMGTSSPADDLLNVARRVTEAKRFTAWWDRNKNGVNDEGNELSSIDHILVAPELASRISKVEMLQDHEPAEAPDHFGVLVEFDLGRTREFAPITTFAAAPRAGPTAEPSTRFQIVPGQGDVKYVMLDGATGQIWERVTVDGKDEWKAVESPASE